MNLPAALSPFSGQLLPQLLAWLATYLVHSTVLLGLAWMLTRPSRGFSLRLVERIWRVGVLGPLLTASIASLLPHAPVLGVISVEPPVAQNPSNPRPSNNVLQTASHDARRARVTTSERAPDTTQKDSSTASTSTAAQPAFHVATPSGPTRFTQQRQHPPKRDTGILAQVGKIEQESTGHGKLGQIGEQREHAEETYPHAAAQQVAEPVRDSNQVKNTNRVAASIEQEALEPFNLTKAISSSLTHLPKPSVKQATGLLWTIPALVLGLALLASAAKLAWDLRRRKEVRDADLLARFDSMRRRAGLRRPIRLSVSAGLKSPITFGLLRPEVSLPPRALEHLSPAHERSIFAHELAHVVRHDPAWFAGLAMLERILFFQPLLRVARKELVEVAEERADDLAVTWTGNRIALASCLAEIASWILDSRARTALPIAGMASSRLGHRIERLLAPDPPPDTKQHWFSPLVLALLVTTASAAPRVDASASTTSKDLADDDMVDDDVVSERFTATIPMRAVPLGSRARGQTTQESTDEPQTQTGILNPSITFDATKTFDGTNGDDGTAAADESNWQAALRTEFAQLEEELALLNKEFDLLRTELGQDQEQDLRSNLIVLERRLEGLNSMRELARALLEENLLTNTPFASTPRATGTALESTQP